MHRCLRHWTLESSSGYSALAHTAVSTCRCTELKERPVIRHLLFRIIAAALSYTKKISQNFWIIKAFTAHICNFTKKFPAVEQTPLRLQLKNGIAATHFLQPLVWHIMKMAADRPLSFPSSASVKIWNLRQTDVSARRSSIKSIRDKLL